MAVPTALVVVTEAGGAAFLRPLLEQWDRRGDWRWCGYAPAAVAPRLGGAASGLPADEAAMIRVLDDLRPDVALLSAAGHGLEDALIGLCRARGIPTLSVIDAWYNFSGRFGDRLPDRILCLDDRVAALAAADGLPPDRLRPVGHPAWEVIRPLPAAPTDHVAFIGQPVRRVFGNRLGYDESSVWALVTDLCVRKPGLCRRLVYVPHPAEAADGLPPQCRRATADEALAGCGVIVGMFSALLVEAHLAGRHVVSFQPSGGDRLGGLPPGIVRARDAAELELALASSPAVGEYSRDWLQGSLKRLEQALCEVAR